MSTEIADCYLDEMRHRFAAQKQLADRALTQVDDRALSAALSNDGNSIGILMKHVGGNLHARWKDVFASDGEEGRDRDAEFEHEPDDSPEKCRRIWERGWTTATEALDRIGPADLTRTVMIRGESMLLIEALGRSLTHTAQHVGQVVLLARHFAGPGWKTLSIPRGGSRTFRRVPPGG